MRPSVKPKRLNPQQRELAAHHAVFAQKLARRYCVDRSITREVEEVEGAAYMGLMDAAYSFSAAHGVMFTTFAKRRILGAIVDSIRWRHGREKNGFNGPEATTNRAARKAIDKAVSLSAPISDDEKVVTVADTIRTHDDHESRLQDDSEVSRLLARFKLHEQFAYRMYYGHDYTMDQVGKLIGVCGSAVCHMLTRMQKRLEASHAD